MLEGISTTFDKNAHKMTDCAVFQALLGAKDKFNSQFQGHHTN